MMGRADGPCTHTAARVALGAVFAALLAAPAWGAAEQADWAALRTRVVDLETYMPGEQAPLRAVGFVLDGLPGIVTCYRLVNGAERVVVRATSGDPVETRRCLAADAAADLVLLDAPRPGDGLAPGPSDMLALGQPAFALLPPASREPAVPVPVFSTLLGAGPAPFLALVPLGPSGSPLADSLGRVVGVVELLRDGAVEAGCAIPVERVLAVFADAGAGEPRPLRDLPAAADWTRPATPQGAQMIGASLSRMHRLDAAGSYLERAIAAQPPEIAALLEYGMLLQSRDDLAAAEASYRRALDLRPDLANVYLFLGACLQAGGFTARSQEVYEEGLQRDPQSARLHVNLGGIFFLQNKRDVAEQEFREALRLAPHLGLAHYDLGMLLLAEGRDAQALEVLRTLERERSGFAGQLRKNAAGRLTNTGR